MCTRVNIASLALIPLLGVSFACCSGTTIPANISQVCAGTYDNIFGTTLECSGSVYPMVNGTGADSGAIGSDYVAHASEQASPGQITVVAETNTEPNLPNGLIGTASAIGQYVDNLTFQRYMGGAGATITTTPLILLPGSAIEISEPISASVNGFAQAQAAIDFGNPGDINSIITQLNTSTGKFQYQSGNRPNGAKASYEDLGGILNYYIQDPNMSIMQSVRFALTDAVSAADNGYAAINDPVTFTLYDPNGNIIPDVIIRGSSGYEYTATDGYASGSGTGAAPTPEPSSLLLLATGLVGACGAAGQRQIYGRREDSILTIK